MKNMKQKQAAVKIGSSRTFLSKIKRELVTNRYLYLMAIPILAYFIIFCYMPMYGIIISFKRYDMAKGILDSEWVGLKHFIDFFKSMYFPRVMRNTLIISLYNIVAGFPAPIIFALLLNEVRKTRFKKLVQTTTYLPHFLSMVVVCGMIVDFFGINGIATKFLMFFGGENMNYVGSNDTYRHVHVWTSIWQEVGWGSIIYLAALTSVDQQLYEAAIIDGANRWKQTWHITLPGIASTIIVMLIMKIGGLLSVGYEKTILLYGPTTKESAEVISSYVYQRGIGEAMQLSYSTAVGLFQSVVNIILLTLSNTISKKFTDSGLF
ncbi:MAG: sugar ABC transporter permease [Clostridia bacterium]|nr:sugar ABC transporter permease [Clostridia bacterium]